MPNNRYGIEIEFVNGTHSPELYSIDSVARLVESVLAGLPMDTLPVQALSSGSSPEYWTVKPDGSCEYEVCTPALTWEDWPQVDAVVRALRAAGARTNRDCGLHVHHEVPDFSDVDLRKLWYLWYLHEPALFSMLAPSRTGNSYCESLRAWSNDNLGMGLYEEDTVFDPDEIFTMDRFENVVYEFGRYQSLNLTPWWSTGRVEIRAHHGTLRAPDIRLWTRITQRLMRIVPRLKPLDLLEMNPDVGIPEQMERLAKLMHPKPKSAERWLDTMRELTTRRNPLQLQPA